MKLNELKDEYDRLLKDSDFDKLELGLKCAWTYCY